MADLRQIAELAGKVLIEADFRKRFLADPEKVAESIEVILTAGQADFVRALDPTAVEKLAADFAKPPEEQKRGVW